MVNANIFGTMRGQMLQPTDTTNNAGGKAYKLSPQHALAQYVVTGCFNNSFYVSAQEQLSQVLDLCKQVDEKFVALAG